ncbi:MAG: hypothetical protein CMI55_01350 [Parcubacteria group bacterium]|nr:hypothetical protein [Parcubacteria group bacterium]
MKPRYKTVQGFCEFIFLVSTISVVAYWITEYYKKRTKGAKVSPDKKRQNSLSGWNRAFIAFAGVWTALMIYIAISDVMDGHSLNLLAFKFWLIPIGFVYIAGWTIGWIRRGFKQDN